MKISRSIFRLASAGNLSHLSWRAPLKYWRKLDTAIVLSDFYLYSIRSYGVCSIFFRCFFCKTEGKVLAIGMPERYNRRSCFQGFETCFIVDIWFYLWFLRIHISPKSPKIRNSTHFSISPLWFLQIRLPTIFRVESISSKQPINFYK